jgi:uncharacterized protein (TIGR02246 family)
VFALVVAGALLVPDGLAQDSGDATTREVRRLEDELTKALLDRDASALDRLWHDDLLFIARDGSRFTKSERIAGQGASSRQPGETNVNDDIEVRVIGETAITTVVSTWTFPSDSGPMATRYRALHVWVLGSGRWQLLAAQVASLPR